MIVHPPVYRLYVTIPWIPGIIRMTVVAGFAENDFYIIGYGENSPEKIGMYSGSFIPFRVNKLDNNQ